MTDSLISIAKILNFHGIRGEAKLGFSKGREKQIENLKRVYVLKDKNYKELNVSSVRFHKHFAIVKFKEFQTVNDVEEYKGCDIFLEKTKVEETLDNDEYLISDLIGLDVFDEDGCCIGKGSVSHLFHKIQHQTLEGNRCKLHDLCQNIVCQALIDFFKGILKNIIRRF